MWRGPPPVSTTTRGGKRKRERGGWSRRGKNNVALGTSAGHPENKKEKGDSWDDEKREREEE